MGRIGSIGQKVTNPQHKQKAAHPHFSELVCFLTMRDSPQGIIGDPGLSGRDGDPGMEVLYRVRVCC